MSEGVKSLKERKEINYCYKAILITQLIKTFENVRFTESVTDDELQLHSVVYRVETNV